MAYKQGYEGPNSIASDGSGFVTVYEKDISRSEIKAPRFETPHEAFGDVLASDGSSYRPVQDCSSGYGFSLGLAEFVSLTRTGYAQAPVGTVGLPANSGIVGPHTFNRMHHGDVSIEVLDLFAPRATIQDAFAVTRADPTVAGKLR